MATRILFLLSCLLVVDLLNAAVPLVTEPKSGEEFVYVQRSGSGARPIARKEKPTSDERPFETAHKLPPSLTYILNQNGADEVVKGKKQKREALPATVAPAPAGSIKIDPLKLIEKYKADLKTSSTASPKVASTKRSNNKRRMKKEARPDPASPTSPRPVLTSGAPPTPRTLTIGDAPLAASSEKQRSRIQIKKGPNGQEYEYEYVYYYYDDDDDKETTEKVLNSHDGPGRDELSSNNEEKTHYSKEAASNEVIPSGRARPRGRQLEDEDTVGEDRLPPSTRFPPRSRNLATTPATEEESKATRGRGRGRATTVAPSASTEADSVSEETQGSRGRTRANVRRPSLDLVDSASFNTQSGTAGAEAPSGGPSFPSDLPSGPVRFLGATPNERVDLQDEEGKEEKAVEDIQLLSTEETDEDSTASAGVDATTTMMSPMDKVALDLYAILQGTQKLSGEGDLEDSTATTDGTEFTTLEAETTEVPTTEYTTPSTTTTTTTTTTTPPPTTTTTTEAPAFGRGGFRRGGATRRKHGSTTPSPASTESSAPSEPKTKSRFGRPSYGRPRPGGARTTSEPAHEPEATKDEAKPSSRARPTAKSRFGAQRTRPTTTESSGDHAQEESASSTSKPGLSRPRPGFNVRGRGRSTTTAAPAEGDAPAAEEAPSDAAASSTTAKPKLKAPAGGSNVRPLRPGPRINLRRPGVATTTTAAPEAPAEEAPQEEADSSDEPKEETPTSPAPVEDKNPLHRLRNRQRVNAAGGGAAATPASVARPKAAASASVQVRRVNPLIGRRRPGAADASSTEAPKEAEPTEAAAEADEETEAAAASSSSTTEEPKGLNKLLAGRRRLAVRPGSHK